MTERATAKVYACLKKTPGMTVSEIYEALNRKIPVCDIERILKEEREYIEERDIGDGKKRYFIKIILGKVKRKSPVGYWNYEKILAAGNKKAMTDIEEEEFLPRRGDVIIERSQGNTPTCVGNATASLMDDIHMALCPEDAPTEEDKKEYKHNVDFYPDKPGLCYYDVLWPQSFSAAGIYWESKKLGNIMNVAGSDTDLALELLKKQGAGLDRQWILFKDGKYAFRDPYPDLDPKTGEKYYETAAKHKIDGYALCMTTRGMMQALKDHDGIGLLAGIEIAEYTFNSAKGNGIWKRWRGESIGAHAILIKGRKKVDGEWGWVFYNSWCDEGYPREEWMSDSYWNRAKIDCFVALDSYEAKIARKKLYQHVVIVSNKQAKIYIDGEYWGDAVKGEGGEYTVGAELLLGEHKIKATTVDGLKSKEVTVEVTKDTGRIEVFFEPDAPSPKPNSVVIDTAKIIEKLREIIKKIIHR